MDSRTFMDTKTLRMMGEFVERESGVSVEVTGRTDRLIVSVSGFDDSLTVRKFFHDEMGRGFESMHHFDDGGVDLVFVSSL